MGNEKVMGYISLVLAVLVIVFTIITLKGSPITTVLMLIGFFYVAYKTLYKKEKLTTGEWVAIIILCFLFFLPFLF